METNKTRRKFFGMLAAPVVAALAVGKLEGGAAATKHQVCLDSTGGLFNPKENLFEQYFGSETRKQIVESAAKYPAAVAVRGCDHWPLGPGEYRRRQMIPGEPWKQGYGSPEFSHDAMERQDLPSWDIDSLPWGLYGTRVIQVRDEYDVLTNLIIHNARCRKMVRIDSEYDPRDGLRRQLPKWTEAAYWRTDGSRVVIAWDIEPGERKRVDEEWERRQREFERAQWRAYPDGWHFDSKTGITTSWRASR